MLWNTALRKVYFVSMKCDWNDATVLLSMQLVPGIYLLWLLFSFFSSLPGYYLSVEEKNQSSRLSLSLTTIECQGFLDANPSLSVSPKHPLTGCSCVLSPEECPPISPPTYSRFKAKHHLHYKASAICSDFSFGNSSSASECVSFNVALTYMLFLLLHHGYSL